MDSGLGTGEERGVDLRGCGDHEDDDSCALDGGEWCCRGEGGGGGERCGRGGEAREGMSGYVVSCYRVLFGDEVYSHAIAHGAEAEEGDLGEGGGGHYGLTDDCQWWIQVEIDRVAKGAFLICM